jgi:hypothetical protein
MRKIGLAVVMSHVEVVHLARLVELFGVWGFAAGIVLSATFLCTNRTITPKYSYLYPLVPFNGRALASLFLRFPKKYAEFDKK